jgi:DNA-binding XRE family transcriptional regulator
MNAIRPIAETAETVTLSRADFEAMLEALEDAEDVAVLEAAAAEEARVGKDVARAESLPVELVERMILGGESPVRIWREHRGMTGKALAAVAGVSSAYLSEIEAGKKPGSFDAMAKLAKALGVSLDDLAPAE